MKEKEKKKIEYSKKDRLIVSALTAFVVSFVYCFFGPVDIYANNKQEFNFTFFDFAGIVLLISIGVFLLIGALLYLLKGKALNAVSAIIFSTFFSVFINNNFISKVTFSGGDASALSMKQLYISGILFIAVLYIFVLVSLIIREKWKSAVIFLFVLLIGMNGASLASDFISKKLLSDKDINCNYVMSNKDLLKVSEKENIIYILFDRFDTNYYDKVIEKYPDYFDCLDGFTYYDSATAMYTRTFPAATYMMTGIPYAAQCSPQEYFEKAYKESPFFKDLINNGYKLNLYIDKYYEYEDAQILLNIAENVEKVDSYKANTSGIINYLMKLSFARNYPAFLSLVMYANANHGTSSELSELICDSGTYHDNDKKFNELINKYGLSYSSAEKQYVFLYLHGSHTPFILDESCEYSDNATDISQTIGAFKNVSKYLDELKRLGVYDNSTIVIAGDHGIPLPNDSEDFSKKTTKHGKTTAIFIKPRNSRGALKTSSAEVSVSNTFAFMINDAELKSTNVYDKSALEINENEAQSRTSYQAIYDVNKRKITFNKYIIEGDAKDINNWKIAERIKSDYSWY